MAAASLVLDFIVIALVYRAEMARPFEASPHPRVKVHAFLMAKGLAASAAMLAFFFAGAHVSVVALTAGAALLLTRRVKPEKVFLEINWNLLTFFAGLLVVVGAARASASEYLKVGVPVTVSQPGGRASPARSALTAILVGKVMPLITDEVAGQLKEEFARFSSPIPN